MKKNLMPTIQTIATIALLLMLQGCAVHFGIDYTGKTGVNNHRYTGGGQNKY